MTLDGIEKILHEHFPKTKVHLIRYVDDFLVTAPTKEIAAEVRDIIREFLAIRDIEISLEKTLITHIDDGFDFLGCHFRKYKGQLLIKPSEKSIKSIYQKLKTTVSNARS
jgi:RNA-directed DNA polymerase